MEENREEILSVKDLVIHYFTDDGEVHAVNGISFSLRKGETLGLVGETGAGKTTTALGLLRLVPDPPGRIVSGSICLKGKELTKASEIEMRLIRGNDISMIFQDPMTSLNPVMRVGDQIAEVVRKHRKVSRLDAEMIAADMLETVGIPRERMNEYPHQFSGGMKQRVVIAIALACRPEIIIADEPTTALDVTIQAQVLELMRNLREEYSTSMLLITHDLGVVAEICSKVAIMYSGTIVESGTIEEIYEHTAHPYTIGLFGSLPSMNIKEKRLHPINGLMPDPTDLPKGCPFAPRCSRADERCRLEKPEEKVLSGEHRVRCFHPEEK
ncbi:MAG: ABC transporter ATP-binding protein [Candidatus Ornithospirochaeta sp.]|nr:ABC transporter ATP-binding protein [Candidatus Ornithospirochaeta sp.]